MRKLRLMEDTFFICGCIISLKPKLYSICFPRLHLFIVILISDVSQDFILWNSFVSESIPGLRPCLVCFPLYLLCCHLFFFFPFLLKTIIAKENLTFLPLKESQYHMPLEKATIKITSTKIKQQCPGVWLESGPCQAISLLKSKHDARLRHSFCCNVDPCDWW